MRLKPLLKGILTLIPWVRHLLPRGHAGPHTSAVHCYERWMKHLVLASRHGMRGVPVTVAELGPGDSLGVGLAALLSGSAEYHALDAVRYADRESDLKVFDELVELFETRAARPVPGWPDYADLLDEHGFPGHILTPDRLAQSLNRDRMSRIRHLIADPEYRDDTLLIRYTAPWNDKTVLREASLDLMFSHSVLQHVASLEAAYEAMAWWLRPGGVMCHQIDFGSMGMSSKWNGHWACSELMWKLIEGRRPYLINRQPCSAHVTLTEKYECEVTCLLKYFREDGVRRAGLSSRWNGLSDEDLTCAGAFLVARRRSGR